VGNTTLKNGISASPHRQKPMRPGKLVDLSNLTISIQKKKIAVLDQPIYEVTLHFPDSHLS
jgi:hypothetical protein